MEKCFRLEQIINNNNNTKKKKRLMQTAAQLQLNPWYNQKAVMCTFFPIALWSAFPTADIFHLISVRMRLSSTTDAAYMAQAELNINANEKAYVKRLNVESTEAFSFIRKHLFVLNIMQIA